ncbi:hypothetical protein PANN_12870 [Pseudomonas aeruginosa C-NN2]|nr:hypothetical protein PANN_12870 [Pseudomonas aeruginosa C-NN2]
MPLQGLLYLAEGSLGIETERPGELTAELLEPTRRTMQIQPKQRLPSLLSELPGKLALAEAGRRM